MSIPIYSGHSAEYLTPTAPDYVGVIAGLPRGDNVRTGNPEVPITFQVFTSFSDPDQRTDQAAAHSERIAAIIDLFDDNNFATVRADLNPDPNDIFGDQRAWKGLGFTGWEPNGDPEDARDETRYIASLHYIFEVFKEDDTSIDSSIQYALENALKSYITDQDIF